LKFTSFLNVHLNAMSFLHLHVLWTEVLSSQVNPDMVPEFEKAGLQFVGKDDTGRRMEV
jgi:hypothetical protein